MKNWLLAARPKTLTVALAPVLVGSAYSWRDGFFSAEYSALIFATAILIQIGTNLCNDYYDFKKGADTAARVGPVRASAGGLISPLAVRNAFIGVFAVAAMLGLVLVFRGGLPILVIGVFSIAAGIAYTAGPYALAYVGLGELFVLIFFGPVAVAGTYYVQSLAFSWEAALAGIALGLLACAILVVNNLRDIDQDKIAHKKTLAVRFGRQFAHAEYVFCLLAPALIVCWLAAYGAALLVIVALFFMRKSKLAQLLPQTALLVLGFGIVLALEITQKSPESSLSFPAHMRIDQNP
ncbi:MAG: 1,4-dihydroxy-2-naphthoate polyprenyltransferase [Myxococcota bacterium]